VNSKLSKNEAEYLARVKMCRCSVCGAPPPSEAHHIRQGLHYATAALCVDCHRGSMMGWHGQKRAWSIRKIDEMDALNDTIKQIIEQDQYARYGKTHS
jgi:hypothetical protein